MRRGLIALLLVATAFAGCASDSKDADDAAQAAHSGLTSVFERAGLPFNVTGDWSATLGAGAFGILDPVSLFVDIDLPEAEGGAAIDPTDPPRAHVGLFLPDIPGCDFVDLEAGAFVTDPDAGVPEPQAGRGPDDCRVPVIADAGPYWGESDVPADERGSGRLGEFLITNFVPHGYAVAQISVMGSGRSNHCFDMFGLAEQLGVAQSVEWLGAQEWSNGNVGLVGRSYDGSTPWMAAAHAGPGSALKTIVPISGLSGLSDLVTWNGASEARVLLFHNVIYGQFGLNAGLDPLGPSVDPGDRLHKEVQHRATCPDWVTGTPWGGGAYLTGDHVVDVDGTYWQERSFVDRSLQNYEGSIYLIHGLLDDNVDPHAGWIAHQAMIDKGLETKGLYGQWFHSYPDRPGEHGGFPESSVRYDWAQDLLEWFDHYLMGTGDRPPLHIEVQERDGRWRIDDGLMPSDARVIEVPLGIGTVHVSPAGGSATYSLGVLDEAYETVLAGLSDVRVTATPTGPGGQVYVELLDLTDGETFGLSYGIAELRHAPGSGETPPVPGVAMEFTIPIQYFSAALEAGHELGIRIAATGNDYLPSPVVEPVIVDLESSTLRLSTRDPAPGDYFTPPAWEGMEEADGA